MTPSSASRWLKSRRLRHGHVARAAWACRRLTLAEIAATAAALKIVSAHARQVRLTLAEIAATAARVFEL